MTLSSIGDAVIATDANALVNFMKATAEKLTGWAAPEALGKALREVFNIVNEETRKPVESPVSNAIRIGGIVGLANHALLIAGDGTERLIDDGAAPIRDGEGRDVHGRPGRTLPGVARPALSYPPSGLPHPQGRLAHSGQR